MFDFDTPNFALRFTKGDMDYKVGIEDFDRMLKGYELEKQNVIEQPLDFTSQQTKQIVQSLRFAYRPENRYYRYGFLQRNCSTELRDLIFEKTSGISYSPTETGNTYRYYLKNYTKSMPWMRLGINLALGSGIDKKITTDELMFLPRYLSEEVEKATTSGRPLVSKKNKILDIEKGKQSFWKLTPIIVFTLFFVFMVLTKSVVMSKVLTFLVGIAGTAIFAISLYSLHPEVHYNYNLLWCNPLYLVAFIISFFKSNRFHKLFTTLLLLCLIAVIVIWVFKIQGYVLGFFPIVASLFWINLKTVLRNTSK